MFCGVLLEESCRVSLCEKLLTDIWSLTSPAKLKDAIVLDSASPPQLVCLCAHIASATAPWSHCMWKCFIFKGSRLHLGRALFFSCLLLLSHCSFPNVGCSLAHVAACIPILVVSIYAVRSLGSSCPANPPGSMVGGAADRMANTRCTAKSQKNRACGREKEGVVVMI